jgi:hypothetical protein
MYEEERCPWLETEEGVKLDMMSEACATTGPIQVPTGPGKFSTKTRTRTRTDPYPGPAAGCQARADH